MHAACPKELSRAALTPACAAERPRRAASEKALARGRAVAVARAVVRRPVDTLTCDVLCRGRAAESACASVAHLISDVLDNKSAISLTSVAADPFAVRRG